MLADVFGLVSLGPRCVVMQATRDMRSTAVPALSRKLSPQVLSFFVRAARLQNEVGTKYSFGVLSFLGKDAPKFRQISWPLSCGSGKKLPNSPEDQTCSKRKYSPTNFCRGAGRSFYVPAMGAQRFWKGGKFSVEWEERG